MKCWNIWGKYKLETGHCRFKIELAGSKDPLEARDRSRIMKQTQRKMKWIHNGVKFGKIKEQTGNIIKHSVHFGGSTMPSKTYNRLVLWTGDN